MKDYPLLKDVARIKPVDYPPNGIYLGKWSGYQVVFETPNGTYKGCSHVGVRGLNVPCVVEVKDGLCRLVRQGTYTKPTYRENKDKTQ